MAVILTKGIISTATSDLYLTADTGDARYYIKSEVNIISGGLQDQIDNITVSGVVTDHSLLSNLDYDNAGHTGFQPAGDYATIIQLTTTSGDIVAQIPSDYYTTSQVDTISGSLQTQISAGTSGSSGSSGVAGTSGSSGTSGTSFFIKVRRLDKN